MSTGVDVSGGEQIGTSGLIGAVKRGMVAIKGPCDHGQVLSMAAAEELRDWISKIMPKAD
jgi:hypothetical protein